MDMAAQVKAGVVWINATNMFDANAPFGGMRASGFGREGAREGMAAYLRKKTMPRKGPPPARLTRFRAQARPRGWTAPHKAIYRRRAKAPRMAAQAGRCCAMTRALAMRLWATARTFATPWKPRTRRAAGTRMSGHQRAQVLYFLAETLDHHRDGLAALVPMAEIDASIARTLYYAAMGRTSFRARCNNTQSAHGDTWPKPREGRVV